MRFSRKATNDEIPTASTADIAFLLIVYFMVTTVFASIRGLDFTLPKEEQAITQEAEEAVEIKILPDGSLLIDQKPKQISEILSYLEPILKVNKTKPVIILPYPDTPYRYMVDVFDELRMGEEKIGIAIKNISIPSKRDRDKIAAEFGIDFFGG